MWLKNCIVGLCVLPLLVGGCPLSTSVDGQGTVEPAGGSYPWRSSVTLTAFPDTGWRFEHWEGALTGHENPTQITMDSAKSVTAVFRPNPTQVGLAYGPYRQHERPPLVTFQQGQQRVFGLQPLEWELQEDADILGAVLQPFGSQPKVRVYGARSGPGDAAAVLAGRGFFVTLGLFVSTNEVENDAEIDAAIALIERFPTQIVRLVVGNETQGTGPNSTPSVPFDQLIDVIRRVKARLAGRASVAVAEVFWTWLKEDGSLNEALVREVDDVIVHIYGYWDGVAVESSVDYVYARLDTLRDALAARGLSRPIVLGETGWPIGRKIIAAAEPGPSQQRQFLSDLLARSYDRPEYEVFLFSAFSEPWKLFLDDGKSDAERFDVEDKWGILTWQRRLQPALAGLFPNPPAPRAETSWFRVFHRGQLSPGHDLGVGSSSGRSDWLAVENDQLVFRYPDGNDWGTVYVTRGAPSAAIPRPSSWNQHEYSHIVLTLARDDGSQPFEVFIKDADDPDDGTETKLRILHGSPDLQTVVIPLAAFNALRTVDLSAVYVDAGFVFQGAGSSTVRVSEVFYVPSNQAPPQGDFATSFHVMDRGYVTFGHGAGAGTCRGEQTWSSNENDQLVLAYPQGNCCGFFYVTSGDPQPPESRTRTWDLSSYSHVVVLLAGDTDALVELFIKDADDPDDGSETKLRMIGLTPQPSLAVIPIDAFDAQRVVDRSHIYVDAGFSFDGRIGYTVRVSDVYFVPEGQPLPQNILGFEPVVQPVGGEADVFVDGCVNRWLTVGVATASGSTDEILATDPTDANALQITSRTGEAFVSAYFIVNSDTFGAAFQDFSHYQRLLFDVQGAQGGEPLNVGTKDDQTEGAGPRIRIEGITQEWQEKSLDLSRFSATDFRSLSVVFELVFADGGNHQVSFRNVRFE